MVLTREDRRPRPGTMTDLDPALAAASLEFWRLTRMRRCLLARPSPSIRIGTDGCPRFLLGARGRRDRSEIAGEVDRACGRRDPRRRFERDSEGVHGPGRR